MPSTMLRAIEVAKELHSEYVANLKYMKLIKIKPLFNCMHLVTATKAVLKGDH